MTTDIFTSIYIARSIICTEDVDSIEHAIFDAIPYVEKFKKNFNLLSSSPKDLLYEMSLSSEMEVSDKWIRGTDTYNILSSLPLKALYDTVICVLIFSNGLVMCVGGNNKFGVYYTVETRSGYVNCINAPDNALMYETNSFKAMFLKKKVQFKVKVKIKKYDGIENINKKRKIE